MGIIDAYYKFKLVKVDSKKRMKIMRIEKVGNYPILNSIFENHEKFWIHKITPHEVENYIGYVLGTEVGIISWLPLIFETSIFHFPYGFVKSNGINEIVLFRITNELFFEVYVINREKYDSLNYLQLMMEGHLEEEIIGIQNKCK